MSRLDRTLLVVAAALAAAASCGPPPVPLDDGRRVMKIETPPGLPPLVFPPGNPPTEAALELGRRLFYDRNLAFDGTVACSSCHNPKFGFGGNKPLAEGVGGRKGLRNAPTIYNVAYGQSFFWDGRAATLEAQAAEQLVHPAEMAQSAQGIEQKLNDNSIYRRMFERAYGPGPATFAKVAQAIAVFQRLVISGNSLFDKYRYLGNQRAISDAAIRGLAIFQGRGKCAACHTIGKEYALFTDGKYHNLGAGLNARGVFTDPGRFRVTGSEADRGAFKTPTLRNINQTRPYMHDGSLSSLAAVIEFYDAGGRRNPHQSPLIRPLGLSPQDKIDLLALLESFTGEPTPYISAPEGEM